MKKEKIINIIMHVLYVGVIIVLWRIGDVSFNLGLVLCVLYSITQFNASLHTMQGKVNDSVTGCLQAMNKGMGMLF